MLCSSPREGCSGCKSRILSGNPGPLKSIPLTVDHRDDVFTCSCLHEAFQAGTSNPCRTGHIIIFKYPTKPYNSYDSINAIGPAQDISTTWTVPLLATACKRHALGAAGRRHFQANRDLTVAQTSVLPTFRPDFDAAAAATCTLLALITHHVAHKIPALPTILNLPER
jgi:hypothetical protein